jgi:Tol biopolymer transport system component
MTILIVLIAIFLVRVIYFRSPYYALVFMTSNLEVYEVDLKDNSFHSLANYSSDKEVLPPYFIWVSPNGRYIARLINPDPYDTETSLHLHNLQSNVDTIILHTGKKEEGNKKEIVDVQWFPNKPKLLIRLWNIIETQEQAKTELWVYDVSNASLNHLMDEPAIGRTQAWSSDGQLLAFFAGSLCPPNFSASECAKLRWRPSLKIVNLEDGTIQVVVPYEQLYESLARRAWNQSESNINDICDLRWSPDSKFLSFISGKQCDFYATVRLSDRGFAEVYLVDVADRKLKQLTNRSKLQPDEIANGYTGISVVYSIDWKNDSNALLIGWYRPTWNLNLPSPKDIGPASWGIDIYQPIKNQLTPLVSENKDKYVKHILWSPHGKYVVWDEWNEFQLNGYKSAETIVSQMTDQFTLNPVKRYSNDSRFRGWLPDGRILFLNEGLEYKILNVDTGQIQDLELLPNSGFIGISQPTP